MKTIIQIAKGFFNDNNLSTKFGFDDLGPFCIHIKEPFTSLTDQIIDDE